MVAFGYLYKSAPKPQLRVVRESWGSQCPAFSFKLWDRLTLPDKQYLLMSSCDTKFSLLKSRGKICGRNSTFLRGQIFWDG